VGINEQDVTTVVAQVMLLLNDETLEQFTAEDDGNGTKPYGILEQFTSRKSTNGNSEADADIIAPNLNIETDDLPARLPREETIYEATGIVSRFGANVDETRIEERVICCYEFASESSGTECFAPYRMCGFVHAALIGCGVTTAVHAAKVMGVGGGVGH